MYFKAPFIFYLKFETVPEQGEAVFVQTHGRALGPEEVLGELVGDEAHGEAVAVAGAAALGRALTHSEL